MEQQHSYSVSDNSSCDNLNSLDLKELRRAKARSADVEQL